MRKPFTEVDGRALALAMLREIDEAPDWEIDAKNRAVGVAQNNVVLRKRQVETLFPSAV